MFLLIRNSRVIEWLNNKYVCKVVRVLVRFSLLMKKTTLMMKKLFQGTILPSCRTKIFFLWEKQRKEGWKIFLIKFPHCTVIIHWLILENVDKRAWFETNNIIRNMALICCWGKVKERKKINGGFRLMKIMSAKVKGFLYFLKKYYITCKKTMKTLFFEILASEIHYI